MTVETLLTGAAVVLGLSAVFFAVLKALEGED